MLDLWVLAIAGIVGYVFRKVKIDPSPLIVALVLGPLMEKTLRQSLFSARGDWTEILARPLTLALLALGAAVLIGPALTRALRRVHPGPAAADMAP
jgi:putative tricarboxylic transport membrane protein